jgi:predicted SAM-dependent methyltransferase
MTTKEQKELIEFLDEVLAQKPLSDEDIDAMYAQHLNDNDNQ